MEKMIIVKDLSFNYNNDEPILANVSFDVAEGEIVSILGPSGCGKTTLLRIISGLIIPSLNQVLIDGINPEEAIKKRMISYLSQENTLLPNLTVKQNISLPLVLSNNNDKKVVEEMLDMIGLSQSGHLFPKHLSGGMKQRTMLAQSIVTKPKVLLMDEPLTSIDEMLREKILSEFYDIAKITNQTIITVTHNIDEAVCYSDRIIVVSDKPCKIVKKFEIDKEMKRQKQRRRLEKYNYIYNNIREIMSKENEKRKNEEICI